MLVIHCCRKTAKDIPELKKNQITCVINCAQGKRFGQVDTNEQYYADSGISYFGIPGHDSVKFDLSLYFKDAAEYIKEKLETGLLPCKTNYFFKCAHQLFTMNSFELGLLSNL